KPTRKNTTIIRYFIAPAVSPLGPKRSRKMPFTPMACTAQTIQQAKKIIDIAKVMFRSALPPRNSGLVTWNPCGVCTPQPMLPTPGSSPNQLVNRIKMNTVPKNQNVFFTRPPPMMPSRNSYNASTSHSQKFCAPEGTGCILRVATRVKTIRPNATTHVTTIELEMREDWLPPIESALGDKPCSSGSAPFVCAVASAAGLGSIAWALRPESNEPVSISNIKIVLNNRIRTKLPVRETLPHHRGFIKPFCGQGCGRANMVISRGKRGVPGKPPAGPTLTSSSQQAHAHAPYELPFALRARRRGGTESLSGQSADSRQCCLLAPAGNICAGPFRRSPRNVPSRNPPRRSWTRNT